MPTASLPAITPRLLSARISLRRPGHSLSMPAGSLRPLANSLPSPANYLSTPTNSLRTLAKFLSRAKNSLSVTSHFLSKLAILRTRLPNSPAMTANSLYDGQNSLTSACFVVPAQNAPKKGGGRTPQNRIVVKFWAAYFTHRLETP